LTGTTDFQQNSGYKLLTKKLVGAQNFSFALKIFLKGGFWFLAQILHIWMKILHPEDFLTIF